jgi:transcriptional regulator
MYVPELFEVSDREAVFDLVDAYPFATALTAADGEILVSHLPVILARADAGWGTLRGHVARANAHRKRFDGETESLLIFNGPHAYVSPSGYADGPAVPTWNYVVVHAYGRPRIVDDSVRKTAHLDDLVSRHEPGGGPLDVPDAFRRSLEKGIVAFEMTIERLEAKFKLGQNKSAEDRAGTVAALSADGGENASALAAWTRRITGVR